MLHGIITVYFKPGQKEVLQYNEQEIEELQESISSISEQLLEMQTLNFYSKYFIIMLSNQTSADMEKSTNKIEKFTQTVVSCNGCICVAEDDYNDTVISFKKDELLQLSTNGYEVQSLETGQKSVVPMIYIGYSMVELLYLFQFSITEQKLPAPLILSDDDKAKFFIQKITDDLTLLQSLRIQMLKKKCK